MEGQSLREQLRVIPGGLGQPEPPRDPDHPGSWVERVEGVALPLGLLAVLTAIRLLVASGPGLAADEAYYWAWSQAPDAGYVDHPPLVAWMIRVSTSVFGGSEFGVRALGVILGSLGMAALVTTARRPVLTFVVVATMPLFALGGLLATPDVPLVFGWATAVAAVARGGRWWLLAGAAAGVAAMGKLTGLLLFPLLLVGRPRDLRSRWPWLGALLLLVVILPNLAWQAANDWVGIRFQLGHGFGLGATERPGLGGLLEFLAGQAALVSPLLFACGVAFWLAGWRERGIIRLYWWVSFPPFLLFAVASTLSHGEANWPAPAWLGAALGMAHLAERWRRVAWAGGGLALVLSGLLTVHVLHPLWNIKGDPTLELHAGPVLAEAVEAWGVEPVYTERYQEASWIRFYGRIHAEVLPDTGRPNQYDLWPRHPETDRALYVRPWRRSPPRKLDETWVERSGPNTVVARDDLLRQAGRWQVYELRGRRGGDSAAPPDAAEAP